MESDNLQDPQEETLTCSICQGIFMNPVYLKCGHKFCEACLLLFQEDIKFPAYCPTCMQPFNQEYINDISLKKQVSIVRKKRLMEYLNSEEHKCVTHKAKKMIFCDKSKILLCHLCSDSQEHSGHTHCSIDVAVQEKMVSDVSGKQKDEILREGGLADHRKMLILIRMKSLCSKSLFKERMKND